LRGAGVFVGICRNGGRRFGRSGRFIGPGLFRFRRRGLGDGTSSFRPAGLGFFSSLLTAARSNFVSFSSRYFEPGFENAEPLFEGRFPVGFRRVRWSGHAGKKYNARQCG